MSGSTTGYRSYVICTSPRSGSTLLCKLLAATGIAGHPGSHFHVPDLGSWLNAYDLAAEDFADELEALKAVFQAARERGAGGTGIFGLRLQRKSFDFFAEKLNVLHPGLESHSQRIEAAFGKTLFIHLTRQDKLAQAVSLVKATQSGLWHQAPDGTELERLSAPQEPVYDEDLIAAHFDELTDFEAQWTRWFAEEQIEPLRISYDELSRDPEAVLVQIIVRLGLDPQAARDIPLPVAKLADGVNQAWIERFRAERRKVGS